MAKVYLLQHSHETAGGVEDVKLIGVYSSREAAQAALVRLSRAPGFAESVDGFRIDEYRIDHDQWVEGYSTIASP